MRNNAILKAWTFISKQYFVNCKMTEYAYILLFFAGVLAGFVNVMAGGGSALTLPLLIFLGLDGATANGTNRLAILIQNVFAVWSFKRQKQAAFKQSFYFALATLPGAVIGALTAVRLTDFWFRKILGIVIVFVIFSLLIPKPHAKNESKRKDPKSGFMLYLSLFGIGFYGGFIQAGVGFLLMSALYYLANLDLVRVNVHKVFIVFIYTVPALAIFALTGNIDWLLGFILAAGNALGGWLSAHLAVKKGIKIVRLVLLFAFILMAAKLIFT